MVFLLHEKYDIIGKWSEMSVYRMQFLTLCSTSVDQILSISEAQLSLTLVGFVIKGV